MDKLLIAIVIAVIVRVAISLVRRAFTSRGANVLRSFPSGHDDEETRAASQSSESGNIVLTGVRGFQIEIDGVSASSDGAAETVAILRACAGRHSIIAARDEGRFSLEVFLHPHEDMVRALVGGTWREPTEAQCAVARRRATDGTAATVDYADVVIPRAKLVALVDDRIDRAVALFAHATELVLGGAGRGDVGVTNTISAIKPLLDGAGLTKSRFVSLTARVLAVVEVHAHDGDRSVGVRLAELALELLPEEPKLLVQLAEIEAARGNAHEAKALLERAHSRSELLVGTGLNHAWLARADAVLAESDACRTRPLP